VAADVAAAELAGHLPSDDLGAPVSAPFLAWLGQRLEVPPGLLDVVLVHRAGGEVELPLLRRRDMAGHPRVARAYHLREDVHVYADLQERGLVTLGRGLLGRWEISLELDPPARGSGLGRAMIAAARALVPAGEPLFAQVSPGNARSLRAFLVAGFRPIGAEVLFP
jgi:GNAT superfamily N-acetyltransferase